MNSFLVATPLAPYIRILLCLYFLVLTVPPDNCLGGLITTRRG